MPNTTIRQKSCSALALLILLLAMHNAFAQQNPPITNTWALFAGVKFTDKFDRLAGEYYSAPQFGPQIRRYDGEEVLIKGHYMPLEYALNNVIILSKHPYSACFFCGMAGPETVAEIYFTAKTPKLKPDQVIQVRGKLKLNDKDLEHLNFILVDAEIIGM